MALTKISSNVIANNTIAVGNIADNSVDATKIASNSILTRHIDDNQIGIDQLNVSDGSSGQALTTNGSGTLSFASVGVSGISSSADATAITIDSSEKVGIGTTSPDGLLHISSGNSGDAIVIIEADEDNNDEGDNAQLWFKADGDITEAAIRQADNELQFISNVSVEGGFTFFTGTSDNTGTTDPSTGATEKMRLTTDGNLGIGDTSPANFSGYVVASLADSTGGIIDFKTTGSEGVFARIQGVVNNQLAITNKQAYPLTFGTNDTTRMTIDSAGIVTKPYQPAFHAYDPSSATSGANVIFESTYVNTGSHYSTSNGRFTAPVAGVYVFFWSAIGNNNNDVYRFFLYKNGSVNAGGGNDIHFRVDTLATGSEYGTNGSRVQMLSLAANDYVNIYFAADSGNSMYHQSDYANFGGFLLG